MNKKLILTLMAVVLASAAMAQGNGIKGITDATSMVTSYFAPLTKLIYAVGAVVGLIGGIKVLHFPCNRGCRSRIVLPLTMAEYMINKGVGKQVEFKGLRAQYVFIFAGGLLGVFVLFVVLYMMGAPPVVCITIALVLGTALVWFTFHLNAEYGAHGLMKLAARHRFPRRISSRKTLVRLIARTSGIRDL